MQDDAFQTDQFRHTNEKLLVFVEFANLILDESEERRLYRQPMVREMFAFVIRIIDFHEALISIISR